MGTITTAEARGHTSWRGGDGDPTTKRTKVWQDEPGGALLACALRGLPGAGAGKGNGGRGRRIRRHAERRAARGSAGMAPPDRSRRRGRRGRSGRTLDRGRGAGRGPRPCPRRHRTRARARRCGSSAGDRARAADARTTFRGCRRARARRCARTTASGSRETSPCVVATPANVSGSGPQAHSRSRARHRAERRAKAVTSHDVGSAA